MADLRPSLLLFLICGLLASQTAPAPRVVIPGTESSPEKPGRPPSDAIVLFNGTDLSHWVSKSKDGQMGEPKWKVENGYMEVVHGSGSLVSKEKFGSAQIHVEWATPAQVRGSSQNRGNSGVFLMRRWEIQVLDSWENPTYAKGEAAAIYDQKPPLVNASRKPGEWQVYDIIFDAPTTRVTSWSRRPTLRFYTMVFSCRTTFHCPAGTTATPRARTRLKGR